MAEVPIACTLGTPEARRSQAARLGSLVRSAVVREPTDTGVHLEFEPSHLGEISAVVDVERTCCAFLAFRITVTPAGGPIALDVEGPPGAREAIDAIWTDEPTI